MYDFGGVSCGMLEAVSLGGTSVRNTPMWGGGGCLSVTVPDDQGFHEEIQFVLLGTHLRQRLGTEGRRPLAAGVRGCQQRHGLHEPLAELRPLGEPLLP